MAKDQYLDHLNRRLQRLETRMDEDRKRLARGTPGAKVEAAGDLALIERRISETKEKLARVKTEPEGGWEDFKTALEEDFDDIEFAIERWAARQ